MNKFLLLLAIAALTYPLVLVDPAYAEKCESYEEDCERGDNDDSDDGDPERPADPENPDSPQTPW
jgi:hypothetical protein